MTDGTTIDVCNDVCVSVPETKKIGRPNKHPERQYYKNRDIEKTREYQREYKRKKLGCVPRDVSKIDKLKIYIDELNAELNVVSRQGRVGFSEDF